MKERSGKREKHEILRSAISEEWKAEQEEDRQRALKEIEDNYRRQMEVSVPRVFTWNASVIIWEISLGSRKTGKFIEFEKCNS